MNKAGVFIMFVVAIALVTAGVLYFLNYGGMNGTIAPSASSTNTTSGGTPTLVLGTPSGTAETVSDGTITFGYPSDFGFATNPQQILVRSYIPPCDQNFNYCLYYVGTAYQGTNFDAAGIRIESRPDLTTQTQCLTAAPSGYTNFTPTTTVASDYSLSVFSPLGNSGAGHLATGALYRLSYNGSCYEFETRIGQSQFANYPSGTIQQFTSADEAALESEIIGILNGISLPSGEKVVFPA